MKKFTQILTIILQTFIDSFIRLIGLLGFLFVMLFCISFGLYELGIAIFIIGLLNHLLRNSNQSKKTKTEKHTKPIFSWFNFVVLLFAIFICLALSGGPPHKTDYTLFPNTAITQTIGGSE